MQTNFRGSTPGRVRPYPRAVAVTLVTAATFVDLVAYSVAVPVLPDLAARLGATPTTIGFLFASFGLTLVAVSIPMGMISDRIGRKGPMVAGLVALTLATLVFAFSRTLPWLFAARLIQGAADGVTWVVGFALIADLYGPAERGRVMGMVMAGTGLGILLGPPLGGWLYQFGGISLPFIVVSVAAAGVGASFAILPAPPAAKRTGVAVAARTMLRTPGIAACAAAAVASAATLGMLEPVLPLFWRARLNLTPVEIGLLFGLGALAATLMHPIYGRIGDRWGNKRLTVIGLMVSGLVLPFLSTPIDLHRAAVVTLFFWTAISMTMTPSLAYMAQAASAAERESYGVVYGLYNVAWGVGLLAGPAVGGFLYERLGFFALCVYWVPVLIVVALWLMAAGARVRPVAKPTA